MICYCDREILEIVLDIDNVTSFLKPNIEN